MVRVDGTGLTNLTSEAVPGELGTAGDNFVVTGRRKTMPLPSRATGTTRMLRREAQNQEIYVINADGSGVPERLTFEPGSDANPAWSPKGDKIAFESNRSGRPEIWVMNADGSGSGSADVFRQLHAAQDPVD